MNWLIILIGVVAVFFVSKIIHFRHIKHRITAIILIILVLFVYSTFSAVVQNNDINIKSASGIISAGKVYFSWLANSFENLKVLTGNALKMDWFPKNGSILK